MPYQWIFQPEKTTPNTVLGNVLTNYTNFPKDVDSAYVTAYSYTMTRDEKLLNKAKNNPSGLSFNDFQTLMSRYGWIKDHQSGSHQIWYSPKKQRISVQNKQGKAKGYQVKQFIACLDEEL